MIFSAQWAKPEDVVHLRYDPNGGAPQDIYPNVTGFSYKKNATAAVWDNTKADGTAWFSRNGYTFVGWNTKPDGSGTAYAPDAPIVLTELVTTLYAQWEGNTHTLFLCKIDSEGKKPLSGAMFGLYFYDNGEFRLVETLSTGSDGRISFPNLHTDVLYKLVEERPPNGYATIAKEIGDKLDRGATFLHGEGSYSGTNTKVVLVAIKKQQLAELKELVMELDPSAFVILQEAHQVLGDGFHRYSKHSL
jgi:hypothetical protein